MPEHLDDGGAAISREARAFWQHQWQGQSLMAIGQQDPVLGEPVMRMLAAQIRACPAPLLLADAGHFVPEHGSPIARTALAQFSTPPRPSDHTP